MKTFTDNAGRTWTVCINVSAVKRVRDLLGVDLAGAGDSEANPLLAQLLADPVLLCDVAYCLVKPQADERGVSDEEFGSALGGDSIGAVRKAVLEELVNFSPSQRARQVAAKQLEKLEKLQAMALEHVEKQLDGPGIEQAMQRALEGLGGLFGNLRESPESTRGRSH